MRKLFSLLIVGVCFLALVGCQNQSANVASNRTNAEDWVKQTLPGYSMSGFSTSTLDTDGDGYISVDITVQRNGSPEMKFLQLDCPTAGQPLAIQKGGGCKYKQMPFDPRF